MGQRSVPPALQAAAGCDLSAFPLMIRMDGMRHPARLGTHSSQAQRCCSSSALLVSGYWCLVSSTRVAGLKIIQSYTCTHNSRALVYMNNCPASHMRRPLIRCEYIHEHNYILTAVPGIIIIQLFPKVFNAGRAYPPARIGSANRARMRT